MITRFYECRTTTPSMDFTFITTVSISFDDRDKIKDVEQYLKNEIANHLTRDNYRFTSKNVKLKLLEK